MAKTITNQASISYSFNKQKITTQSNIVSTVLNDYLEISKTCINENYRSKDIITFIINIANFKDEPLREVVINDNLGTYTFKELKLTPLSIQNTAKLFIQGVETDGLKQVINANGVSFMIPTLPANSNAQIIYDALVNETALISSESTITSEISTVIPETKKIITDINKIVVEDFAKVEIIKTTPAPSILTDSLVTYNFILYNYGNIDANNIVLSDNFTPQLNDLIVEINNDVLDSKNYTYVKGNLTMPSGKDYVLSLPKANILQDEKTGKVTIIPSSITITVTGTI